MGKLSIAKIPFLGLICYRNIMEFIYEVMIALVGRLRAIFKSIVISWKKFQEILKSMMVQEKFIENPEKFLGIIVRFTYSNTVPNIPEIERKMLVFIIMNRGHKNQKRRTI